MEGDFGRPRTFSVLGHPLDAAYWASDATHLGAPSHFELTADETEMRASGYRLRVQAHTLTPVKFAYRAEAAYAANLTRQRYKFGPGRTARIADDLQADHAALSRFAVAARRVLAADRARAAALAEKNGFFSSGNKRNTRNRMRENFAFIEGTFIDLEQRLDAYQFAIDRTRLEAPGASPFAVEGSLNHLRDRAASLHYELSQAYQVARNHAQAYPPTGYRGGRRGRWHGRPHTPPDGPPLTIRPEIRHDTAAYKLTRK